MAVGKKLVKSNTNNYKQITPQQNKPKTETKYSQPTAQTQAAAAHQVAYTAPVKSITDTGMTNKSTQTTPAPSPSPAPTYTAPASTAPASTGTAITPMIGTTINPAGMIQTSIERQLAEQNQQTLDPHTNQMSARPNESPSATTNRYLGVLNSITGNNGTRPYSSPNFGYEAPRSNSVSAGTGYDYGEDTTLNDFIHQYNANTLVGEPGSNAPFAAYPQVNLNNANLAVNGPTTVGANQQATPTLNDLIAAQFANDYGTPATNNPITAVVTGAPLDPYAGRSADATNTALGLLAGDVTAQTIGDTIGDTYGDSYSNKSGNGGGSRGTGGTPAYENGYDLNSLYDLLNARLNEYNNQYGSLMEALLGAYNANNANLDEYYQAMMDALGLSFEDTQALLRGQLGQNQQSLEDERRRALQEAYIARMMSEKQLADQLDAYGLTGGASESVMANLRNNYMNNRASVEEKTQNSLADLLQNYLTNLNSARANYNSGLMSAAQNRLNARQQLANNLASSQADAANYLANARSGAYEDLFNTLARLYT